MCKKILYLRYNPGKKKKKTKNSIWKIITCLKTYQTIEINALFKMIHFKISPEEKFYPKKIYKDFLTVSTSFFQGKKKILTKLFYDATSPGYKTNI